MVIRVCFKQATDKLENNTVVLRSLDNQGNTSNMQGASFAGRVSASNFHLILRLPRLPRRILPSDPELW